MKKITLGILISAAVVSNAHAEEYTVEVGGGVASTDSVGGSDASQMNIRGKLFFSPVETGNGPLAEAAFLNRASNIHANIIRAEDDYTKGTESKLGVEVFLPNTVFYGAFDYQHINIDNFDSTDSWTAKLGITPMEGLLLSTRFMKDVDYDPNVNAKYIHSLPGGQALGFTGDVYFGEDNTSYALGADYYITTQTSFGFEYRDITDAPDAAETITLRAKHFFDESVFIAGHYTENDLSDELGLELGVRF